MSDHQVSDEPSSNNGVWQRRGRRLVMASALLTGSIGLLGVSHAAAAECVDTDGDGYGWDGNATCDPGSGWAGPNTASGGSYDEPNDVDHVAAHGAEVAAQAEALVIATHAAEVEERAEAVATHVAQAEQAWADAVHKSPAGDPWLEGPGNVDLELAGPCVDSDGDGWGWNGSSSCEMPSGAGSIGGSAANHAFTGIMDEFVPGAIGGTIGIRSDGTYYEANPPSHAVGNSSLSEWTVPSLTSGGAYDSDPGITGRIMDEFVPGAIGGTIGIRPDGTYYEANPPNRVAPENLSPQVQAILGLALGFDR